MKIYTEDERAVVGHKMPGVDDEFCLYYITDPAFNHCCGHAWITESIMPANGFNHNPQIVPYDKFTADRYSEFNVPHRYREEVDETGLLRT